MKVIVLFLLKLNNKIDGQNKKYENYLKLVANPCDARESTKNIYKIYIT